MLGELLALLTAVLWALTPVFGKKALEESSIVALNFVRSVFGSMALWLILPAARGWRLVDVDPYSLALLTAAAVIGMGLGDLAFFKSMDMIGVSKSTAISSTYPLFTTFISILLLGESLTVLSFLGTVSVVLGVSLISIASSGENGGRDNPSLRKGVVLAIASAVIWSIGITLIALCVRDVDPLVANTYRLSILALILSLPPLLKKRFRRGLRSGKTLFWGAAAGVTGLSLGTSVYLESIKLIGAARATALSSIYPMISAVAATLFLKEKPNLKTWMGIGLTVLGIVLLKPW